MASRTVLARLVLDGVQGVVTGFKAAGSAAVEYGSVAQKAGITATRWVDKHQKDLSTVGGSLLKMGAVGALALGGLAKSAIDWETAWTGVTKTVDGTPEQLKAVEDGLRGMAKVLPTSHKEIAAVAEAAGQLGIKQDSIVGFTRTMIDLGETTNLSSEEAASSLAKMMNIMGTASGDVDRMGSTIVALGNNSATTEADIVQMATRLSGVGKQMGMTEADVLSMAAAMSSVGIEAEAGGTAASTVMKKIDAAVREGGTGLENWAKIAGVSAADFSTAWKTDAAGAVATLTEGLGGMIARGDDANGALKDLGVTGIRESDTLLRLAGATEAAGASQDLLRESLKLGGDAWAENTALAEEAEKRYSTRASKAKIALNSIKDEAITLGQNLLPMVDGIVSAMSAVADAVSGLPDPVKDVGTQIAVVGTVGALAAGGIIKAAVGLVQMKAAVAGLGIGLRGVSVAMGVVGIALAAAGTLVSVWVGQQAEAKAKTDAYTEAIKAQGEVIGQATRDIASDALQKAGVLDLAASYGVALADVTSAALGNADAMDRVKASVDAHTAGIQSQIDANDQLLEGYRRKQDLTLSDIDAMQSLVDANSVLSGQLGEQKFGVDKVTAAIEAEKAAIADAAGKTQQLAEASAASGDASKDDAAAKQEQQQAIQDSADATKDLIDATFAYANAILAVSGTQIGMDSSISSLTEHMAELKKEGEKAAYTLDTTTRAGQANQQALDSVAASSIQYASTLKEQGYSADYIAQATARSKDEWIKARTAMGGNVTESKNLADALFAIPGEVTTAVAAPGATQAKAEADKLNAALEGLPDSVKSTVIATWEQSGFNAAEAKLRELARSRTATINVRVVGGASAPVMGRTTYSANGNIIDYHASGAIRENHVAQIAPAGAWRVWAEDETGGESYIPLHPSKRRRSLDIWQETGRRLGVRNLANGAIGAGSGSSVVGDTTTSFTFGPGAFDNAFPGVRTAAEIERVLTNLPQLAQMNGRPLNG